MEGYGSGLARAATGAENTAQGQYNTEYAGLVDQAKTKYQGAVTGSLADYQNKIARVNATYDAAMKDWLRSRGGRA